MLKKLKHHSVLLIVVGVFIQSCGKKTPDFTNINFNEWRQDRNGCLNKRKEMIAAIEMQKGHFLSLSEMQIVKLFGRPDENELYERNQKFYYYFLSPSKNCVVPDSSISKLEIRFNAVGVVKEVDIINDSYQ